MIRFGCFIWVFLRVVCSNGQIVNQPASVSVCPGGTASFSITDNFKTPKTYTWERFTRGSWQSISAGGVFSGNNSATLIINPAQDSLNRSLYRCIIDSLGKVMAQSDTVSLTVIKLSVAASSVSGVNAFCLGKSSSLSVNGGSLGGGAAWKWFTGSCGGTAAGTGNSLSISPAAATTYFVRAEGTCNITSCVSVTVTVQDTSMPANSITAISVLCLGKNTTLSVSGGSLGTGASWKWYSGSCGGNPLGNGTSIITAPAATTNYFVRAEGTCNNTLCRSVTVIVQDTSVPPNSISGASTICKGKSTSLSVNGGSLGNGAIWRWFTASCGGSSVGTGASIIVAPTTTTTYFVRAEGSCNNTVCRSVTVTVQDTSLPAISINAASTIICLGKSITLSVSGGSLGAGASWKWYSGSCGGTWVGTGSSVTVAPATTTTYLLRAEGTCNNTICRSVIVTVQDTSVSANRITGPSEICFTQNATLSASGGSLGNLADWKWYIGSCGATLIGTGSSIVVSPSTPGTYTYYLRAEGACNKTVCRTFNLTVRDTSAPAISISGSATICRGRSTTLSVNGGTLAPGAVWRWYSGSCGGASIGSGANISVLPSTTTTYFVRAEGICNMSICRSITVNIQDTSMPAVSISGPVSICSGTKATLNIVGGSLGFSGVWRWYTASCGGTAINSGSSITVSPTATTTYFVRAEGTCNITVCRSLVVGVQDTSISATGINGATAICAGKSTTLSITGGSLGSGATWKWYSDNCGLNFFGTGTSIEVKPSETRSYFVRAEGNCNTTDCKNFLLTVNDTSVPAISITGSAAICLGRTSNLGLLGGQLGTGAVWKWYTNNCAGFPAGTGTSINVSPNTTTRYFIRAEGFCNNTTCQSVLVVVNNPPKLFATGDTVCWGEQATLSASGAIAYEWTPTEGLDNSLSNRPYVNLSKTISKPTAYIYTVKGTDWNRCTDSIKVRLVINNLPPVNAGVDVGICSGKSVRLRATGARSYAWQPSPSLLTINKDTTTAIPTATSVYRVTGTDSNQCKNRDSVTVKVFALPIANAGKDDTICNGKSYILNGSGGGGYFWSGTEPVSQINIAKPNIIPIRNAIYVLRVTDINGCIDFDTVAISVVNNPVPQIFGKTAVCKNEHETKFNTTETKNAFHWQIKGGSINSGQGMSSIIAQWNSTDTSGKLTVTEALRTYPYCSATDEHNVKIGGTIAPTPPNIVLKANALESQTLICPKCNFENYQWGYESKTNRTEINTCKNIVWCSFSRIDTVNNFYWLKVGNDINCQTKAYFNAPKMLGINENNESNKILIYPNPAREKLHIQSLFPLKLIALNDGQGRDILKINVTENNIERTSINISHLTKGIYFLRIQNTEGFYINKLIIE
jgi:hypothetical protein